MADQYTGTGQVSVNVEGEYKQAFLSFLQPNYYYTGFGKSGGDFDLKMNSGTKVTWDRPTLLPAATTPIPEYVTPAPLAQFSTTPVSATIAWYGDHLRHSDRMALVALNRGLLAKMREMQVVQHRLTMDTLCRDAICAGTQKRFANGSAITDVNTVMDTGDLDFCLNALQRTDVQPVQKKINPSQLVGTLGLREAYVALGHTDLEQTIKGISGFVAVTQYAAPGQALPGEVGAYRGIRFVLSSNGKINLAGGATGGSNVRSSDSSHADVYQLIIFGQDFFGETKLAGKGLNVIVKPAGSSGSEDPHNQRGSCAWNQAAVYTILDNARGICIYAAAPTIA
jgi:N4-gp56 family major capsid protein